MSPASKDPMTGDAHFDTEALQPQPVVVQAPPTDRPSEMLGVLPRVLSTAVGREAGEMFAGAIRVMKDRENPERFVQAAHSLRELVEKLPSFVDLPIALPDPQLKSNRAHHFVQAIKDTGLKSMDFVEDFCRDGRCLLASGPVLTGLRGLLEAHEVPSRTAVMSHAVVALGSGGLGRSEVYALELAKQYAAINTKLNNVSHHQKTTSEDEFAELISGLAQVLLDTVNPTVADDASAIDALVERVEGTA